MAIKKMDCCRGFSSSVGHDRHMFSPRFGRAEISMEISTKCYNFQYDRLCPYLSDMNISNLNPGPKRSNRHERRHEKLST